MMSGDRAITAHYLHGELLQAILASMARLGKTIEDITIEDLAAVDEFHVGGRIATGHLLDQLGICDKHHVLDVGCGLGGAARFAAKQYGNRVTGIDLSREFIETGNTLCAWVGLQKQVALQQGSATAMPFDDECFDGGYMLHAGMNIEDKDLLFREVHRVLRPGAKFGVYDIMRDKAGELAYPVPWATEKSTSKLATAAQYENALGNAGFRVTKINYRRDFALECFRKLREKTDAGEAPPALGLHTLIRQNTAIKFSNMVDNIEADYIVPVEIIAQKIE